LRAPLEDNILLFIRKKEKDIFEIVASEIIASLDHIRRKLRLPAFSQIYARDHVSDYRAFFSVNKRKKGKKRTLAVKGLIDIVQTSPTRLSRAIFFLRRLRARFRCARSIRSR